MAYPVFRADLLSGSHDPTKLRSAKYYVGAAETAINNGSIVKLTGIDSATADREVWKAVAPASNDAKESLALVYTPELMADERKRNLDDFRNEAGSIVRAYLLVTGNIFSLTSDGFTVADDHTVAVGDIVELAAEDSVVMHIPGASATASTTTIGKIDAIETVGSKTFYVVSVA